MSTHQQQEASDLKPRCGCGVETCSGADWHASIINSELENYLNIMRRERSGMPDDLSIDPSGLEASVRRIQDHLAFAPKTLVESLRHQHGFVPTGHKLPPHGQVAHTA